MQKPTQVVLTEAQRQALKALAKKTDVTFSEHIRRAVDRYLKWMATRV